MASLEVDVREELFTAIVFLHNSFSFVPGHNVRGGAVGEVFEVQLLLVVVVEGQVDDVAIISPRSNFHVALLLILKMHNLQLRELRDE